MTAPVDTNLPVRVMVVDDHTLFRRGLIALLSRDRRLSVVADAPDAGEALRHAKTVQPDVMLLDNHLPGVHGIDALPQLLEACPNMKIVMLTVSEDANDLANALARCDAVPGDVRSDCEQRVTGGDGVIVRPETRGRQGDDDGRVGRSLDGWSALRPITDSGPRRMA